MNEQRAPADDIPVPPPPAPKPTHDADALPWIFPDHEGSEL